MGREARKDENEESYVIKKSLRKILPLNHEFLDYLGITQIILQDYSTRRINAKFYVWWQILFYQEFTQFLAT